MSFTIFAEPAFPVLFQLFSRDADVIVKTAKAVSNRDGLSELGEITKACTKIEMRKHKGADTTNHWTSRACNNYTTTMFHYIEQWSLKEMLLDFKIHEGSTRGAAVFED